MSYLTLADGVTPATPASAKTRLHTVSPLPLQSQSIGLHGVNASGTNAFYGSGTPWNLLRNSGFWFAQRQDPTAEVLYNPAAGSRQICADGWGILCKNSANSSYQRFNTSGFAENILKSKYYGNFNRGQAGVADVTVGLQVVDGVETDTVRGRYVRVTCKARAGSNQSLGVNLSVPFQIALLSWTGTVDAMTSSLFSTSFSAFTADNIDPILVANWAYIAPARNTGLNCVAVDNSYMSQLTGSWQTVSGTFLVPTTAKNIAVMVWTTSGASASGGGFFIGDAMLTDGEQFYDYTNLSMADEYLRVARFYQKSIAVDTDPGSSPGVNTGEFKFPSVVGASAAFAGVGVEFPVRMYKTPTMTLKNPTVATATVRNVTLSTDCTANSITADSETGAWVSATTPASTAVGNHLAFHWTADAEL